MSTITAKITALLKNNQDVLLVAPTDAGKTYFAKNELIPALESAGFQVDYLESPDQAPSPDCDFYIIDEVEILNDRKFLEEIHPEENPFYENSYLEEIARWHENLSKIKRPCVCILTRNDRREIENLLNREILADWSGKKLEVIEFRRR